MNREEYLLSKIPKELDYDKKYFNNFEKWATYMGGGVYQWRGLFNSCTRLLFLEGVLMQERIEFKTD